MSRALQAAGTAFDLQASDEGAGSDGFAESIVRCLARKGFCVIQGCETDTDLDGARRDVRQRYWNDLAMPPTEIAEGLLGAQGTGRLATLRERAAVPPGESEGLDALDDRMFALGSQLGALSEQHLGFDLAARDHGFLFEAGSPVEKEAPELSAAECFSWLTVFEVHRIMCLAFLGPEGGTLELTPFDGVSNAQQVQVQPGTWVLLRADMLEHILLPQGLCYVLACFYYQNQSDAAWRRKQRDLKVAPIVTKLERTLLQTVKRLKETTPPDELHELLPREVQRMTNQMYHRGSQVALRGAACRFPGAATGMDLYQAGLFMGIDAAEEIPTARWNLDLFYVDAPSEELLAIAKQNNLRAGPSPMDYYHNCKHSSFIEGMELFDNRFFGISNMETGGMDPSQRLMLELFYETAFSAGLRKSSLMKSHTGVYSGAQETFGNEWALVERDQTSGALASTSGSVAITSNRLSFVFGLNGPNFFLACDAASSLMALGLGVDAVQPNKRQCDAAFAMAIDVILHPVGFASYCWAGQMSRRGRCFTFDQSADGYARGEGCGGVYMNNFMHEIDGEMVVDEAPHVLGLVGSTWNQHSGKTASISAPSGAMDQELIMSALRIAEISPLDVDMVDAHGIGGVLADAVEGQALCLAYRGKHLGMNGDDEILGVGCVKTNYGNGKPVAGMYAILKILRSHELGYMVPMNHLNCINPHMMLEDFSVHFPTEHMPQRMNSAFSSITAKGFGGSCAHALLWGAIDLDRVSLPKPVLSREMMAYWPAGGGELDAEAQPMRSYMIAGTWSAWSPEPMKADRGTHSVVVALGELGFERFQIWLDGDPDRALHPSMSRALKDAAVVGPQSAMEAEGCHWQIGGSASSTAEQLALEDPSTEARARRAEGARPGDKFLVKLIINGRYRTITWSRVEEAVGSDSTAIIPTKSLASAGTYYFVANWEDFAAQPMEQDSDTPGIYRIETTLLRSGGAFSIMRNQDRRQALYPSQRYADGSRPVPVLGPDEYGRGFEWWLSGSIGDVFAVELQLALGEAGHISKEVTWRRVRQVQLSPEQLRLSAQRRFYVVGSWDHWSSRSAMSWDGERYTLEVTLRGAENFQILVDGDWGCAIYPSRPDAGFDDGARLRGPDDQGGHLSWLLGADLLGEPPGKHRYRIALELQPPASGPPRGATIGVLRRVSWVRY